MARLDLHGAFFLQLLAWHRYLCGWGDCMLHAASSSQPCRWCTNRFKDMRSPLRFVRMQIPLPGVILDDCHLLLAARTVALRLIQGVVVGDGRNEEERRGEGKGGSEPSGEPQLHPTLWLEPLAFCGSVTTTQLSECPISLDFTHHFAKPLTLPIRLACAKSPTQYDVLSDHWRKRCQTCIRYTGQAVAYATSPTSPFRPTAEVHSGMRRGNHASYSLRRLLKIYAPAATTC